MINGICLEFGYGNPKCACPLAKRADRNIRRREFLSLDLICVDSQSAGNDPMRESFPATDLL